MCGIAGAIDFHGSAVEVDRLIRMGTVQRHRGPDGEGCVLLSNGGSTARWHTHDTGSGSSPVFGGLVHRRLSIIDLSERGRQPMHDGSERLWITYNGEIYNYVELMSELQGLGYVFRSRSDTEVILHAYRHWGPDSVERLNGMFAFAIWDTERRRLFCARDRLGVKPFYYRWSGGRLLFGSEIKAILAYEGGHPSANIPAITDYLCFSFVPSDETFFRGIMKLPPGHRLFASADELRIEPYWSPTFEPEGPCTAEALVDELRGLLDDAVRIQLRSDVPVGAHLSGGIDSSTVCCLASRHLNRLHTFTARFAEGGFFDESSYARLVAGTIGSDHHEIVPSGGDVADLLPKIVHHLDQPVEGPAVFGKFHVAQIVSEHVKVILGGQGGDELFGGYDWYVKNLFTLACWGGGTVAAPTPPPSFLWACLRSESWKRLAKSLWTNRGVHDLGAIFRANWTRMRPGAERALVRADVLNGGTTAAERFDAAFAALPEAHPADRMFHFDVRHYLESLLHSEDRLSMAFSVESRVPLLDHRIAELAARAGFALKATPGNSKMLLRRAVSGIIPDEILRRTDKRGFPTPIEAWLRDPKLRLVERFVLDNRGFAGAVFDLDRVRALTRQPVSLGSSWSETLWRIVNVSVWGEVFEVSV